jgi:hypothetical protein
VLGVQLAQGERGGRRHVRGALVGEGLDAGAVAQHDAQGVDDVVGALARVDDDRVEQAAIATADVLNADELERDPEDRQVGGVGADLGARQEHVEAEAGSARLPRGRRRRRGWARRGVRHRGVGEPVAQGALGQREGLAESGLGERRQFGGQAMPGACQQCMDGGAAQRDQGQGGGGDREQSAQRHQLGAQRIVHARWAAPSGERLDDVGEGAGNTGGEPTDALGAESCGACGLADTDGEPVGPLVVDQGDAEDGEQRSRDRRRGVRRHACPSGPATLCGTGWVVWAISPGFPQSTRAGSPIRGWTRSSRLARVLCRSVNDPPHGIGKHVEYTFVTPIVGPPSAEVVPAPKKRTRGFSVMTTWRSEP